MVDCVLELWYLNDMDNWPNFFSDNIQDEKEEKPFLIM